MESVKLAVLILIAAAGLLPSQENLHTRPAKLIHKVEPAYTKEARDARLQGDVLLSATVGADGIPSDIQVLHKLGKGLDQKAIECLRQWRFSPATDYFGGPAPERIRVELDFRLP